MAPRPKDQGAVSARVRSDAIAKARATGKIQPVIDIAGNLVYYVDGQGNMVADPAPPPAPPTPVKPGAGKGQLDIESRANAISKARRTGKVQPVRDKAGNVLYYVDEQGNNRADPHAKSQPSVEQAASAASSQWLNHNGFVNGDHTNGPLAKETRTQQEAAAAASAAKAKSQQFWLDGKLVTATQDKNHNWVTVAADGTKGTNHIPTAFDALDNTATQIDPTTPFLMGKRLGTGQPVTFGNMISQLGTVKDNSMTVAGGITWLAELSTKDPAAYGAMVQRLHDAGYLSDAEVAQAAGHWSSSVGQAFALAARDTAVVNTTQAGVNTTLDDFLKSKAGSSAATKASSYTPVPRSYTDPADIKASAKTEAEKVLGRHLTSDEEAQLVSHFRSLEDAAYNQIDAAQGNGGARYTPPLAPGQIDAYVSGPEHEQEAANFRAAGYGMALKRLVGLN